LDAGSIPAASTKKCYYFNAKKTLIIFFSLLIIAGCVSNQTVQTVQAGDFDMNCAQLNMELTNLGAKFEEVKSESGATGDNVALGFFFWPGIIVNEQQAKKNQDSINARLTHLTKLYSGKCLKD
jgi:outer membrane murein-binding lipoprotein Lpp